MKNKIKNNYINHKETIHNFTWRALQIFGKQGITFFIFILCAKLLTPHDFGIYNYILAFIYLLIIFGDFGISAATSKYVAEYNATDKNKLKSILFNSLIIILALGIIVTILTIVFGSYFLNEKYVYVLYVLPMLILAPISSLYDGIFRGLKRFRELAIISLSVGFVSVIFVYLLVKNYGLTGALISQSLFYLVLVLSLFFVYGNLHIQFDKQLIRTIFSYSILVGIANLGYFLYTKVDLIMLGYFDYTVETGYYGLINTIFGLSIILFSILGAVIAPDNINLQVNKKIELLKKKIKNYIIYSSIIGFLISIILFILIPLLIRLFLPQYDNHSFYIIFYIFLFIVPISVLEATIATGFITPLGYVEILTKTILVGGIMNCIFNFIFLFYFGYLGIIISTVIVHNAVNIIKIFIFYKKFNL